MKRFYGVLLAMGLAVQLLLSLSPTAQVTAWRPFWLGLVCAFRTANSKVVYTLRVDSRTVDSKDSVYHFNRTVRMVNPNR